jgi:hypothetical protein
VCYYCGGTDKVRLLPVEQPNAQQNTPSETDLKAALQLDEANRYTDLSIEQQIEQLIAQYELDINTLHSMRDIVKKEYKR